MRSSQVTVETLSRLKTALQRRGITQERVAVEAAKTSRRGGVTHSAVSRVFAGRSKSANIVAAAKRLLRRRRNGTGAHAD